MKEKIIQDIKTQQFLGEAAAFIKHQENLISYLRSLDINNIILFWKQCENLMPQKSSEDLASQNDCKDTMPKKNSDNALQETLTCTEEIQSLNKLTNTKKDDNINPTSSRKNNDIIITVPSKFITKNDFVTRWFSWKDEFFTYLKNIDPSDANKQTWGITLLNLIGPIGKQIHSTFRFYDDKPKEDIDVLIKKFDIYCLYGNKKKKDNEDIDTYVNKLKVWGNKILYLSCRNTLNYVR